LFVENIPENESLIIEDPTQKPKDNEFSDLHLINGVSPGAPSLEKQHEVLFQ